MSMGWLMKRHVYELDEVIVGNNLAAVFYAYINNCPIIFKNSDFPFFYERFTKDFPLDKIFLTNEITKIKTATGELIKGSKKESIFNRLLFVLSISGLVPISDKIEKIRIEDDNFLKITTTRARLVTIKYKKLRIFNPEIVTGLKDLKTKENKTLIHDFLKLRIADHDVELIDVGDDFIDKIYFMGKRKKEVLVTSTLWKNQLHDFDFSIVPLKYKLIKILEYNGIQKQKHTSKILVDHTERKFYNLNKVSFKSNRKIIFDNRTEKQICQNIQKHIGQKTHSTLLGVYPWRLNHLLLDSNGMIR